MDNVLNVTKTVLPVFLALLLGMLCRRRNILSAEGVSALRKLAVNITLPAVMLNAFATARYTRESVAVPLIMFGVCCAGLALGALLTRLFKLGGRLTPFLFTGFEAGMLGYSLFPLLFGGGELSRFAMIDLGQVLFVFTVYKALLSGKGGFRPLLREALCSPTLWAIAAGLLIGATGLYDLMSGRGAADVLNSCTDFIAAPTGMIILLSIGYEMSFKGVSWGKALSFIGVRYMIMGGLFAAVLLLDRYILGGMLHVGALALMFILPPPYVLPVFAGDDDRARLSSSLSLMTLASLLLFALLSVLVQRGTL